MRRIRHRSARSNIFDLAIRLAAEYRIASRVWLADGLGKARQQRKPVVDNPFVDSYSIGLEGKAARYSRMVHELPPGLNEWAIHPGLGTRPLADN